MPSVLRGKPALKRMIGAETSRGALRRSFPRINAGLPPRSVSARSSAAEEIFSEKFQVGNPNAHESSQDGDPRRVIRPGQP
jgi:hypothetical protein